MEIIYLKETFPDGYVQYKQYVTDNEEKALEHAYRNAASWLGIEYLTREDIPRDIEVVQEEEVDSSKLVNQVYELKEDEEYLTDY